MKLASYKARKGGFIDHLIALRHFGRYSHSELVFSWGVAYSASFRDKGTRFKIIDFDPAKWDFVDLRLDADAERRVYDWCRGRVGKRYDWRGVLKFINPFRRQKANEDFCSETCCMALQSVGLFAGVDASTVYPSRLHAMAKALA